MRIFVFLAVVLYPTAALAHSGTVMMAVSNYWPLIVSVAAGGSVAGRRIWSWLKRK